VPEGAVPDGPATAAADERSGASRALVRAKLLALRSRRLTLEAAIDEMLDPLAAPKLPAFDVAILLLFLSEMEEDDLPVPVACKEAVALSFAFSGDDQNSHRHGASWLLQGPSTEPLRRRLTRVRADHSEWATGRLCARTALRPAEVSAAAWSGALLRDGAADHNVLWSVRRRSDLVRRAVGFSACPLSPSAGR
jgi:hypothetical protein